MKKTMLALSLLPFLQSCGSDAQKPEKNTVPQSVTDTSAANIGDISKPVLLDSSEIPSEIKFEGKIKDAIRWKDSSGENIVITSETGIYQSTKFKHESDGSDAELFAYHFIKTNGSFQQTWKVYDFISDCPVDIVTEFVDSTFQLTDLDQDGIAEIWMMYKTACHGDVSPLDMKIIMYEGSQKYAIRGEDKVMHGVDDNGEKMYMGGEYTTDAAFSRGPAEFLEFAKKLWKENISED